MRQTRSQAKPTSDHSPTQEGQSTNTVPATTLEAQPQLPPHQELPSSLTGKASHPQLAQLAQAKPQKGGRGKVSRTLTAVDCSAQFTTVVLTTEELELLETLIKRWQDRNAVWKEVSSAAWQATQERMLPFLALPFWEMAEEFEERRDQLGWSETTAAQYWAALRGAANTVQVALAPEAKVKSRLLGYLAKESETRRPTTPASAADIKAAALRLPQNLAVAMLVAYTLGQRIGDVIQLECNRVSEIVDRHTSTTLVAIQFRRGKTVRRRDPFTLHLQANTDLAQEVRSLAEQVTVQQYLFGADRLKSLQIIKNALKDVNPLLGLLSVRRGGLQEMAQKGASLATLLHHSRHTTIQMLDRYLGWGTFNLNPIRELLRLEIPEGSSHTDHTVSTSSPRTHLGQSTTSMSSH